MEEFYLLPLWLQIYYHNEENIFIKSNLRMATKKIPKNLLIKDWHDCYKIYVISWYNINKNYILIASEKKEDIDKYNYYLNCYNSCSLFLY